MAIEEFRNKLVKIGAFYEYAIYIPSLVELDLSRNILQRLNEHAFVGAINMNALHLEHNSIDHLKAGTFTDLTKLEFLYLKYAGVIGNI